MAGTVYLKTNKFEVKLEGITFKARDFESLCMADFLFPKGKVWIQTPVVGLDVMRHPRDPTIVLLLFCFGTGCLIIKFRSGEALSKPITTFLMDQRIRFVGFGIPEKKDLFPFEELGLTKSKVDIGYVAAKILDNPKYKRSELAELASRVLGVRKMVGMTAASSFERHEQIKCAICQLFVSTAIAMKLLHPRDNQKKMSSDADKKGSLFKTLNSLPFWNELLCKSPKAKKENRNSPVEKSRKGNQATFQEASFWDYFDHIKGKMGSFSDESTQAKSKEDSVGNNSSKGGSVSSPKKPLKGILKCPSSGLEGCYLSPSPSPFSPSPSPSPPQPLSPKPASKEESGDRSAILKRANSKGCNVSFKH